jgi:hypothetical protein
LGEEEGRRGASVPAAVPAQLPAAGTIPLKLTIACSCPCCCHSRSAFRPFEFSVIRGPESTISSAKSDFEHGGFNHPAHHISKSVKLIIIPAAAAAAAAPPAAGLLSGP